MFTYLKLMATRQSSLSHIQTTIKIYSPSASVKLTRPWRVRDLLLAAPSRKRGQETRVAAESEAETSAGKLGSGKWEAGSLPIDTMLR